MPHMQFSVVMEIACVLLISGRLSRTITKAGPIRYVVYTRPACELFVVALNIFCVCAVGWRNGDNLCSCHCDEDNDL